MIYGIDLYGSTWIGVNYQLSSDTHGPISGFLRESPEIQNLYILLPVCLDTCSAGVQLVLTLLASLAPCLEQVSSLVKREPMQLGLSAKS